MRYKCTQMEKFEAPFLYGVTLSCSRFKFQFSLFNTILLNTLYIYIDSSWCAHIYAERVKKQPM